MHRLFALPLLLCLAVGASALELNETLMQPGVPRRAVLDYRSNGDVSVEWQFSQDNGVVWNPLPERIARVTEEPSPIEGWTARTGITFPGDFPAGLSIRARFSEGGHSPVLSNALTFPYRNAFPDERRELTLNDDAQGRFATFEAASDMLVIRTILNFDTSEPEHVYDTYWRDGDSWTQAPRLQAGVAVPGSRPFSGRFVLVEGQLIATVSMTTVGDIHQDTQVHIFDWNSDENQWVHAQTLERPPEDLEKPPSEAFGGNVYVGGDYLLVASALADEMNRVYQGSVFVYRREEGGTWVLDGNLRPPVPEDGTLWRNAALDPLVFGDTIIVNGLLAEGEWDRFYFARSEDGWTFVKGEETGRRWEFAEGSRWFLVKEGLSEVENGVGGEGYLSLHVYTWVGGEDERTLFADGLFHYGYFPMFASEDWLFFGFEPSYNIAMPFGGVALAPLVEGAMYPYPALLVPGNTDDYDQVGRAFAVNGDRLYVASRLFSGEIVIDSLDLTAVPHPRYPEITFPKWLQSTRSPASLEEMTLTYRVSSNPEIVTRIMFTVDGENWIQFSTTDENTDVIDPDPDGDGQAVLQQTAVPREVDGEAALYRLIESFVGSYGSPTSASTAQPQTIPKGR